MDQSKKIVFELELVRSVYGDLYGIRGDFITESIKRWGATTRCELAMVLSFLTAGDTVVDVGAHIGTYAIAFASRVGPTGKVFAFEGLPLHFGILEKNVALNTLESVVETRCLVVSDRNSAFRARIHPQNTGDCSFFPLESTEKSNNCITLDEWYASTRPDKIRLLKTDTEGMELSVLQGGSSLITEQKPIIYTEIHAGHLNEHGVTPAQIGEFFTAHGYKLYRNSGEREASQDNFVLSPLERIEEGGAFFDVLAIHGEDPLCPNSVMA